MTRSAGAASSHRTRRACATSSAIATDRGSSRRPSPPETSPPPAARSCSQRGIVHDIRGAAVQPPCETRPPSIRHSGSRGARRGTRTPRQSRERLGVRRVIARRPDAARSCPRRITGPCDASWPGSARPPRLEDPRSTRQLQREGQSHPSKNAFRGGGGEGASDQTGSNPDAAPFDDDAVALLGVGIEKVPESRPGLGQLAIPSHVPGTSMYAASIEETGQTLLRTS